MVSATLAFPISFALVKLYRYTVLKTMAAAAAKPESVPPLLKTSEPSPTQTERQPEATIVDEGPWIGNRSDAEALSRTCQRRLGGRLRPTELPERLMQW
jgi:hypothetical protein